MQVVVEWNRERIEAVVSHILDRVLFERLTVRDPAQVDVKLLVEGQKPDPGFSRREAVAHEADELQVEQVDNLLRLVFIGQIHQDKLSVVRCKPFVDHQRVVYFHLLADWLYDPLLPINLVVCRIS